jgi:hypothetical protein
MRVDRRRALGDRFRQPDRVDDRRVVERIRHHEVVLLDDGRRQSLVGVPRRYIAERCLGSDEIGDRLLELAVDGEGTADEPDAARSGAVSLEPFDPRPDHRRFGGESKIIVRREDEDLTASFHLHPRCLR